MNSSEVSEFPSFKCMCAMNGRKNNSTRVSICHIGYLSLYKGKILISIGFYCRRMELRFFALVGKKKLNEQSRITGKWHWGMSGESKTLMMRTSQ